MSLQVAILAGGLATRLQPITERIPKSLVDVAGQPFAAHQIELLRRHGLTDIAFLVGHLGEMIRDTLGDGARWGVRLRYIFDGPRRVGTGGAIRRALPELDDPFFVLYGDSYIECDYALIERAFLASGKRGLMTVYRNEDLLDRSNVLYADGRIARYDKQHRTPEMRHIDYGLGAFLKSAFEGRSAAEPFDLTAVYQDLLAHDDLAGFEVPDRFYEIGSPAGLEETRAYLAAKGTLTTPWANLSAMPCESRARARTTPVLSALQYQTVVRGRPMVDIDRQIAHWGTGAQEDWGVAVELVERRRIRHGLFFAQLAIEKALKAHVCRRTQDLAPRVHNLVRLAELAGLQPAESQLSTLADLNAFSQAGRYPDGGGPLPTPEEADAYIRRAQEVFRWLMTTL